MKEWFTPAEIVAARSPDLPGTVRGLNMTAEAQGWRVNPRTARRNPESGGGWLYHLSVLPQTAQMRLALVHGAPVASRSSPSDQADASSALWERYEALPEKQKAECQRRLGVLQKVSGYIQAGATVKAAATRASIELDISVTTIFNWRRAVENVNQADWLAALAPGYKATASFADCHPKALDIISSDWLRPERPSFSSCYRRMRKAASANGWLPIPSERAMRRRLEAEVPRSVATLAREGRDKAKTLFPAQKRIRTHLHAMQAVNMDGHKLDVFVRLADGRITRLHLLAIQDLYSGMFVAWRLAETENKETTRLVIGDMVERHGIPDAIVLDNGRAFASKWISGGAANRYRFKIRDEDPRGLLTTLGVAVQFTQPYSGQSKPIERAFRDLTEEIARHPVCAGAYTGNRPDAKPENYGTAAIDEAVFRAHVDAQIHEHNARPGRKAVTCAGRSFQETFEASLAEPSTIIRKAGPKLRQLWLAAAERVRTKRGSGEIVLFENRYWAPALNAHAGKFVTVRFDPEKLQQPISVYTSDDRLICEADCIAAVGFDDATAARNTARDRSAFLKTQREHERLRDKMSADELARIFASDIAPQPAPRQPAKVTRLATGGGGGAAAPAPIMSDEEFEQAFARGMKRMRTEDADIIPFQPKRAEDG